MRHASLLLALAAFGLASCDGTRNGTTTPAPATAAVTVAGRKIDVTLILTEKDRRHAIPRLATPTETRGHLLAWPRERFMKLEGERSRGLFDVAFLDKSGAIVDLRPLAGNDEEGVMPKAPAAYALLLMPGQPSKLGLKVGDKVELSTEIQNARPEELPVVRIAGVTAWAELALTEAERSHGLMFRPRMSPDDGMLFAYSDESPRSFWMSNTLIPLDIAFFADDGTLLNVNETPTWPDPRNQATSTANSSSKGPARYVLEMNLGWFKKKGIVDGAGRIAPGTKAEIPAWAVKGSVD